MSGTIAPPAAVAEAAGLHVSRIDGSPLAYNREIKVFLELMGLPLSMTAEFLEWEMGLLHTNDLAVIAASTRKVGDYLRGEIADLKANPSDDLISYGVTAQVDGRALTDDELVGFTFNLFIGGMDTVSTNIAWQFRHLASIPSTRPRCAQIRR